MSAESGRIVCITDGHDTFRPALPILREAGWHVESLEPSSVGELLSDLNALLIVLDVDPSRMNVVEHAIKQRAVRRIPVLRLIDYRDAAPSTTGADGQQAYLIRPVDPTSLLATAVMLAEQGRGAEGAPNSPVVLERQLKQRAESAEANAPSQAERIAQLEGEVRSLEKVLAASHMSVTARLYDATTLRQSAPDTFAGLVEQMQRLLGQSLEQRAFKVDHHVSAGVRSLSDRLGFLNVMPRDVIEIYSAALEAESRAASERKVQAYVEEGRLIVLELMGHLVSYYRSHATRTDNRFLAAPVPNG